MFRFLHPQFLTGTGRETTFSFFCIYILAYSEFVRQFGIFWYLLWLSIQEYSLFLPFWFDSFRHVMMTGLLPNVVFMHWEATGFLESQVPYSPGCWRSWIYLDWKIRFPTNKTRPGIKCFKQYNNSVRMCEFQPSEQNFVLTQCSSAAIEELAARWWHSKGLPCFRKRFPHVGL